MFDSLIVFKVSYEIPSHSTITGSTVTLWKWLLVSAVATNRSLSTSKSRLCAKLDGWVGRHFVFKDFEIQEHQTL